MFSANLYRWQKSDRWNEREFESLVRDWERDVIVMKFEVFLVVAGLVMCILFGALRGLNRFRGMEAEHLFVLRNLGCLLAIIGLSILIVRTFSTFG